MKKKFFAAAAISAIIVAISATTSFAAEISDNEVSYSITDDRVGIENIDYATPSITSISATGPSSSTISWTKVDGVYKYRVYERKDSKWNKICETTSTSFVHEKLSVGKDYLYTVRGLDINNNFVTDFNSAGWKNTFLSVPSLKPVENTYSGMKLTWQKVGGAENYRVFVKSGSTWKKIGETTSDSFIYTSVTPGKSYTYTVRCISTDGTRYTSYFDTKGISNTFVAAPQVSKIENIANGAKISWNKVAGASKYRVFYRNGSTWTGIGNTADTTLNHTGLKNNTEYTYTVRALDKNGNYVSGFYTAGWKNTFLSVPSLKPVENIYSGMKLTWEKVGGAEKYRVFVKSGSTWKKIGETTSDSFIYTSVTPGKSYTYTVRCISADGTEYTSYFDTKGISNTFVAAPQVSNIENIANGSKISWNEVAGAEKYRVYFKDGSSWKSVGNTAETYYNVTGLMNNTEYTYTVRALDKNGVTISGFYTAGWSNRYFAPPQISSVKKLSNNIVVNWGAVEGVDRYRVYRKTVTSGWGRIGEISDTSFTDTTAQAGRVYAYTVRCLNDDSELISSYVNNAKYYKDGVLANGMVTDGGDTYNFSSGYFKSGYQIIGGKRYYYNSSGVLQKNGIVGTKSEGYYYADSNGVCCESEEMRLAAEFMMNNCKGNTLQERMKSGFMVLAKTFPYSRSYDHPKKASDIGPLAVDMFKNKKGNCFRYAACFATIAKIAGYRTRVVVGTTGGNPHGWTEVLVDDQWLICDPDANLPSYGVPDYRAYMMKQHYWSLSATSKFELTISNGKAVWK